MTAGGQRALISQKRKLRPCGSWCLVQVTKVSSGAQSTDPSLTCLHGRRSRHKPTAAHPVLSQGRLPGPPRSPQVLKGSPGSWHQGPVSRGPGSCTVGAEARIERPREGRGLAQGYPAYQFPRAVVTNELDGLKQ